VIASKNWTLNTAAAARKKFDGDLTGLPTTSTPRKFDSVSRRNSTAPGSIGPGNGLGLFCSFLDAQTQQQSECKLTNGILAGWLGFNNIFSR